MRKLLSAFFIISFALLGGCAHADNSENSTPINPKSSSLADLTQWAGKTPVSIPAKNELNMPAQDNLWDDPRVAASMEKTLGKQRMHDLVTGWGGDYVLANSVSLIKLPEMGDFIGFFTCKARFCGDYSASIFINLADGVTQACWLSNGDDAAHPGKQITSEDWLTISGKKQLAEGTCSEHDLSQLLQHGIRAMAVGSKVN